MTRTSFGIQGSGPLVGRAPVAGSLRADRPRGRGAGFDSLWAGDHVSFHEPLLDITVALSAFAAVTERIVLGAGVLLLPLRAPALVAREFASLDYLSGGRLILGIGIGGEQPADFEAVGVPVRERAARTDEAIAALRALFAGRRRASRAASSPSTASRSQPGPRAAGGAATLGRRPVGGGDPPRGHGTATAGCRSGSRPSGCRGPRGARASAHGARCRRGGAAGARRRHDRGRPATISARRYANDVLDPCGRALLRCGFAGSACAERIAEYVEAGARHLDLQSSGRAGTAAGADRAPGGGGAMLPLADVRVLAVEQFGAGPWGTLQLADLGAEVIKIEDPALARRRRPLRAAVPGGRGLALLRDVQPQQAERLARPAPPRGASACSRTSSASSDVVYSNLRGDQPAKLRLTYDDAEGRQPADRLLLALRLRHDRAAGRARAATTT